LTWTVSIVYDLAGMIEVNARTTRRPHFTKLKERVVRDLRNAVIKGRYAPGDRLVEADLCARYKVSRTPIREALNQLQTEGLVVIIPGAGAKIARLSRKNVFDIYDMLIIIESAACRLACGTIVDEQIAKLEEYEFLFEQATSRNDHELIFQLNLRFHWLITEAANNPYLMETRLNFRHLINRISRIFPEIPGQCAASMEEHKGILEALKARKGRLAEFLMYEHLEAAKRHLMKHLYGEERAPTDGQAVLPKEIALNL